MSLKIAYICLCHTDPLFVSRTAKALQYEDDGFFIHVDNKQEIEPFVATCAGMSNVHFVADRIDNYWGGYHSIIATMRTIKFALSIDDYDRFILLQGQDYPLYSPTEIHNFFETHSGIEFCKAKNISKSKNRKDYMKCCGFWFMDMNLHFPLKYIRSIWHRFNTIGIKYRSPVFKDENKTWDIYTGWAQFALTKDCVKYILDVYENNPMYNKYMKHRFPPDEIYIHTIIYNSPFKDNVSKDVIMHRLGGETLLNLTYFEYPVHVTVFTDKDDYQWLKNTGCLFVRKVNSTSSHLLNEIDKHIL